MIDESEVFKIGRLAKTHGIKGEIAFKFENDIFDRVDCPYLILKIDEILVPFFISEYRFKNEETALITFEDIGNETKAAKLQGIEVWFPGKFYEEKQNSADFSWNHFTGYTVNDKKIGNLGIITDVDTQTINTLFMIENEEGEEIIIPATEDFIESIDQENKTINLNLPEGLIG